MKVPLNMPKRDVSQTAVASQEACNCHVIFINDGLTNQGGFTLET